MLFNFLRELGTAVKMGVNGRFPRFDLLESYRIYSPLVVRKLPDMGDLAGYGYGEIRLMAAHHGSKGKIIDGNERVFSEEA